jgi:hypothetical protein
LPAYCRVVFDNPPLNLMGPEFVAAGILVGAPSLNGKPIGTKRFYGANDPRRGTGLSLGY